MYKPNPDYDTKAKLHLGVTGTIIKWNQENNSGLVQIPNWTDPISFDGSILAAPEQAPQIGEVITIKAQYNVKQKIWQATEITSAARKQYIALQQKKAQTLIRPMQDKLLWAIPFTAIYLAVLYWFNSKLSLSYLIVSCIAFALYAWDKYCAVHQSSRIPESALHAVALLGGWSGALIGRYTFRHKTQKQPFVAIFWIIIVINILITCYLIFSGSLKGLA